MMEWRENDYYWYWFVNIKSIGHKTRKLLLKEFGHPRHVYHGERRKIMALLQEKQREYFFASQNRDEINTSVKRLRDSRTEFIHWESEQYPEKLRQLYDPPYGMYLRGRLPDPDRPILGMVGSRLGTEYGMQAARSFACALVKEGVQIVSGLAAGIDAASHWGALEGNGFTLGILGGGIDTIYPRENFRLYLEMYKKGGVLSEYNLGTVNRAGFFPARNRLISGMSDGIFVLEAGEKSGSLITADQALEQGKEVFALPGRMTDPLSRGTNRLISEGAFLIQKPEDILQILFSDQNNRRGIRSDGEKENGEKTEQKMQEEQKKVYRLLDEKSPVSFNEILQKTGYNYTKLQYILLEMELSQWIYQPIQNSYLKKIL